MRTTHRPAPLALGLVPRPPRAARRGRGRPPPAARDARPDRPGRTQAAVAPPGRRRRPTPPVRRPPGRRGAGGRRPRAARRRPAAGAGPAGGRPSRARRGQSISLQAALYGAITSNPDLVALRNSNVASPEAVEVARRFPTTLNPTLWIDYRPITLIPRDTFANGTGRARHRHADRPVLPQRPELLLPLAPPADRAGAPDHAPLRDRQGRATTSSNGPWSRPS